MVEKNMYGKTYIDENGNEMLVSTFYGSKSKQKKISIETKKGGFTVPIKYFEIIEKGIQELKKKKLEDVKHKN